MKTLFSIDATTEKRLSDKDLVTHSIELIAEERYMVPLKEATTITIDGIRYTRE